MKSSMPRVPQFSRGGLSRFLLRPGELRGVRRGAQARHGARTRSLAMQARCCGRPLPRSQPSPTLPNRSAADAAATAATAVAGFPAPIAEIRGTTVDIAVIGKSRIAIAPIGVVGVPRVQAGTSRRVALRLRMDRHADVPAAMVLARL